MAKKVITGTKEEVTKTKEVIETKKLFNFKKLVGKYHTKDINGNKIVIGPGETLAAPFDSFRDDPTWKRLDDEIVPITRKPSIPKTKLKKILVGDGEYDVIRVADKGKINDKPLTEEEADELVNASLDDN